MTGTADTSKEEFYKVYGLIVTPVPTHNPNHRSDHNDYIFQTEKGKWKALARKIKELNEKGQPVLIGTISIEKNEVRNKAADTLIPFAFSFDSYSIYLKSDENKKNK